jgi:hypothetical protein
MARTLLDELQDLQKKREDLIQAKLDSFRLSKVNLQGEALPVHTLGTKVPTFELEGYFEAPEGSVELIYGRIRQGKSTHAVRCMYSSLVEGRVVYSNLLLDLEKEHFDQRDSFETSFWNLIFGKKRFFVFDKRNFHWFNPTTGECDGIRVFDPEKKGDEVRWLNTLTDCEIYYDEGQWLLDSYETNMASVAKRKLITETGHNNRKIVIIAQRTQSVHVNARGNVNIFWKCKKHNYFFWKLLCVYEFQDMKGQDVDEDSEPVSVQRFWTNTKYWEIFNTHYLRAGKPKSQELHFSAYDYTRKEIVLHLWRNFAKTRLSGFWQNVRTLFFGIKTEVIHIIHRLQKK